MSSLRKVREDFLGTIFNQQEGYLALARIPKRSKEFHEVFFHYPNDSESIQVWLEKYSPTNNIYFCCQLLNDKKRVKGNVATCPVIWADLDTADFRKIKPAPSVVVESSPLRYHAYWLLKEPAEPFIAEEAAKRIAYTHADIGVDQGGWDLTQLLRIPNTYNFKYLDQNSSVPMVKVLKTDNSLTYTTDDLLQQTITSTLVEPAIVEVPTDLPEPRDILHKYKDDISPAIAELIRYEPESDWSAALWKLECMLLEIGMERVEAFAICRVAACNKYNRDNRPDDALWREINKAARYIESPQVRLIERSVEDAKEQITLLSDAERKLVKDDTFIDRYISWASLVTDADIDFHELIAYMVLSTVLSRAIQVPTDYGVLKTNLWAMILADTTVARKSTAMRLGLELVNDHAPDSFLATDGSIEGLLASLSLRPGRPSLFVRDEFAGLLSRIQRGQSYHLGMAEDFAKLYDGDNLKRVLRKETIWINDPVFLLFVGGIKGRVLQELDYESVTTGFIPRFIFAISHREYYRFKSRRPDLEHKEGRKELSSFLQHLNSIYSHDTTMRLPGGDTVDTPKTWNFVLTNETWNRFDEVEQKLNDVGLSSVAPDMLTPMLARLCDSILKCTALLAASHTNPEVDETVIEVQDLFKVLTHAEKWAKNAVEIVSSVGIGPDERTIGRLATFITQNPNVRRADTMRRFRLTSRQMSHFIETLEQRGVIKRIRQANGERYVSTGHVQL